MSASRSHIEGGRNLKPKQPRRSDRAIGSSLKRLRPHDTARLKPADLPMDAAVSAAISNSPMKLGDGEREVRSQVHTQECMTLEVIVNPPGSSFLFGRSSDNEGMDIWPQRARFRERETEYRKRTGATQEELASQLGTTVGNYRNWLYRKDKRPGLDNMQRAASLFGCSVTDFLDDPGLTPGGIDAVEWAGLGESERTIARQILEDLREIPEEKRKAYYDLWRQGLALGRAFKAADAQKK